MWSSYMNSSFSSPQYTAQQEKFNSRNQRLNQAISNKLSKEEIPINPLKVEIPLPPVMELNSSIKSE
jgi:hypothetical protein